MGIKTPGKSPELYQKWLVWRANPEGMTQAEFGELNHISQATLIKWKKAHLQSGKTKLELGEETFLELVKSAKRGNATAGRTVLQAVGMLEEKQGDNHPTDFTPEQYIEISIRVLNGIKQQFREDGGTCPVCGKSSLLSEEVCLPPEQEHRPDSQVGSVAIP